MKKLLLVPFFIITLVILSQLLPGGHASAQSDSAVPSDKGNLLAAFSAMFQAAEEILSLSADFTVQLINTVYAAIPLPLRCLFGLGILIGGFLSLVGLGAIKSGAGFWRRHF